MLRSTLRCPERSRLGYGGPELTAFAFRNDVRSFEFRAPMHGSGESASVAQHMHEWHWVVVHRVPWAPEDAGRVGMRGAGRRTR